LSKRDFSDSAAVSDSAVVGFDNGGRIRRRFQIRQLSDSITVVGFNEQIVGFKRGDEIAVRARRLRLCFSFFFLFQLF